MRGETRYDEADFPINLLFGSVGVSGFHDVVFGRFGTVSAFRAAVISGYAEPLRNDMVKRKDIAPFAGRIYQEAQRMILWERLS